MLHRLVYVAGLVLCLSACTDQPNRALSFNALYENPDDAGFKRADTVIEFEFPRDHGEHLDFQTEWWYVVGIVEDASQREFGFQFTLFRQALTPNAKFSNAWRTGQIYMAHFAIADVRRQEHVDFERFSRGHKQLAGVVAQPFKIYLEDWAMQSTSLDFSPLQLAVNESGYGIELELALTKPIVRHGDNGLSHKSPTNASYYYSVPRMTASGTLTTPEQSFEVNGIAWMDREWSTGLLNPNYQGWNWLTLFFDDGEDLVLFNLVPRHTDVKIMPVGLRVAQDGTAEPLEDQAWELSAKRHWGPWPVGWQLSLGDRLLDVNAAFDDQEMSTAVRYWEGVVHITENDKRVGRGYLELTGY